MKKILWVLAATVAMLSACDINVDSVDNGKEGKTKESLEVAFGAYLNRGVSTKAGWQGGLTTDTLKFYAGGFGVFSYYGNGALYNETSKPDFMYNQQVEYKTFGTTSVWTYSPIKYWPNEYGEASSSEGVDRLTFFAYAPYVEVTPSTGVVTATGDSATTGIIGLTRNITAGDPLVMYSARLTPGEGVDLCWGVAKENFTSSVDGNSNNVAAGYPFINVVKTKTGDHIKFDFNHALAQLNVQVDAVINNDEAGGDDKTKIYVRSVTFNGFSMRGSLNLNSNTVDGPIWYDISGTGRLKREPVTVYDGRTDGMEGVTTAIDPSEKPFDLNPKIVQSQPYGATDQTPGVTATAVNLFNNTSAEVPVMVIPTPGVPMSVTIVYDVETEDPRLGGYLSDGVTHGSSVENRITKDIVLSTGSPLILSAGKNYVINLHLGLTSVKFDVDVEGWREVTEGSAYLPENNTSATALTLNKTSLTLALNTRTSEQLIATVEPAEATERVEWTTSDANVATVSADGTVTAVGAGTATITVSTSESGLSKTCAVVVREVGVTGVAFPAVPSKLVLYLGNSGTLADAVIITPDNASDKSVTWSSSDISVATVNDGGEITTVAGGTTTITVTTNDGGLTASYPVEVRIPVTSVTLNKHTLPLYVEETEQLTVTYLPTDAYIYDEEDWWWESDDEDVATVDDYGNVVAVGVGTATIKVYHYIFDTVYDECAVTVTTPPITTLSGLKAAITNDNIETLRSEFIGKYMDKDGNIHDSKGTDDIGLIACISTSDLLWTYNGSGGNSTTWNSTNISLTGRRLLVVAVDDITDTWNSLNESGISYSAQKPANTTAWYVPSEGQMRQMGALDPTTGAWAKLPYRDYIWSSTAANSSSGRVNRPEYGTYANKTKTETHYVRPVFAY